MNTTSPNTIPFDVRHTFRLSLFQIGSAMGEILMGSVWNRILISTFGIPATPIGIIVALRYLLMPLSLWVGHLSDTKPLWGMRRTSYIWLGRALMVLGLPLLGLGVSRFEANQGDILGWVVTVLSSLLYGAGSLISGGTFLALVRDSAPQNRQGVAMNIVETMLIVFYAISGITFGRLMRNYDQTTFWELVILTAILGGFFWFFAIAGAEKRIQRFIQMTPEKTTHPDWSRFKVVLEQIWQDSRTRRFFWFLSISTMAAWMQELVLEPFGGEVLKLMYEQTTRLSSYWLTATLVVLLGVGYTLRRQGPEQQRNVTVIGLAVMASGLFLVAATSFSAQHHLSTVIQYHLLEISLLVFGAGFGAYTFGGFSLMAAMASDREAGVYMGLWTICILVSKGIGTFLGSAFRDLFLLNINLTAALAYGFVFAVEATALVISLVVLSRLDVVGFVRENGRTLKHPDIQIATTD